jgi:hypothetical protein
VPFFPWKIWPPRLPTCVLECRSLLERKLKDMSLGIEIEHFSRNWLSFQKFGMFVFCFLRTMLWKVDWFLFPSTSVKCRVEKKLWKFMKLFLLLAKPKVSFMKTETLTVRYRYRYCCIHPLSVCLNFTCTTDFAKYWYFAKTKCFFMQKFCWQFYKSFCFCQMKFFSFRKAINSVFVSTPVYCWNCCSDHFHVLHLQSHTILVLYGFGSNSNNI